MASDEREADVDEMGEIWVRGPGVVSGEEWLRTGDLATQDEDGWLHMVGRAHRMINTAGELVAPRRSNAPCGPSRRYRMRSSWACQTSAGGRSSRR